MKTQTKQHILDLISKLGPSRPHELAKEIGITPQALHRQLKFMLEAGLLEKKGAGPKTTYHLVNQPDFSEACQWYLADRAELLNQVSETRDVFTARLSSLASFCQKHVSDNLTSILVSSTGEIGNNCFDHNLGQWKDIPGCWMQFQKTTDHLWVLVADRGQGIRRSLFNVLPDINSHQEALRVAFEERVSGRTPEKRGNGLKYVKSNITSRSGHGIACVSGDANIFYGENGENCSSLLENFKKNDFGTVVLMSWSLK